MLVSSQLLLWMLTKMSRKPLSIITIVLSLVFLAGVSL